MSDGNGLGHRKGQSLASILATKKNFTRAAAG